MHGYLRDADMALDAITAVVDLERVLAFTCERVVSAALFGESLWQEVAVTDGRRLILWHGDDEEDEEDPGRSCSPRRSGPFPLAAVVDQGLRIRYGDGADGARELHAVMLYLSTQTPERSVTELTEDAGTRTMQYVETYRFSKSVTDGGRGQMQPADPVRPGAVPGDQLSTAPPGRTPRGRWIG